MYMCMHHSLDDTKCTETGVTALATAIATCPSLTKITYVCLSQPPVLGMRMRPLLISC